MKFAIPLSALLCAGLIAACVGADIAQQDRPSSSIFWSGAHSFGNTSWPTPGIVCYAKACRKCDQLTLPWLHALSLDGYARDLTSGTHERPPLTYMWPLHGGYLTPCP